MLEENGALLIVPKVRSYSDIYTRADIVFDVYLYFSSKGFTRSKSYGQDVE